MYFVPLRRLSLRILLCKKNAAELEQWAFIHISMLASMPGVNQTNKTTTTVKRKCKPERIEVDLKISVR